jgi:hypothetical protein
LAGELANLPVHGALCGFRKFAVHGLLPDMGVDVPGDDLLLLGREMWRRELREYPIKDKHLLEVLAQLMKVARSESVRLNAAAAADHRPKLRHRSYEWVS